MNTNQSNNSDGSYHIYVNPPELKKEKPKEKPKEVKHDKKNRK